MVSRADIDWIVRGIVEGASPTQVYLFGSYAHGSAHEGSDVDLLIIQPSRLPRHRRGLGLKSQLARIAVDVDLVFYTPEELREDLRDPLSLCSKILPIAVLLYSVDASS
jgi:predicted nucleotidyltransferase